VRYKRDFPTEDRDDAVWEMGMEVDIVRYSGSDGATREMVIPN
jgi:hypothetical protein